MTRIPIITDENFSDHRPEHKQWVRRITKVVLYHLDGTTSEMKLEFPIFTKWLDASELTNTYLEPLIHYWTKYWLKIKAYQVHLGSVSNNGEEYYDIDYEMQEIPLNKVWVPSKQGFGRWVNPEAEKKREHRRRVKSVTKNMCKGNHPISGQSIKVDLHDAPVYAN